MMIRGFFGSSVAILALLIAITAKASDLPPTGMDSKAFVSAHHDVILTNDQLLVRAIILLRLDGHFDDALALIKAAEQNRVLSRRVRYEQALIFVVSGHCDLAQPYFQVLIEADIEDWITQDSLKFQRQCQKAVRPTWTIETTFGYDQNLAASLPLQVIRAEDGSELARLIDQVEASVSGITIDNRFTLGVPKTEGWFVDASANLDYSMTRQHIQYRGEISASRRLTQPQGYDRRGIGLTLDVIHPRPWGVLRTRVHGRRLVVGNGEKTSSQIHDLGAIEQTVVFPLTRNLDASADLTTITEWYPPQHDRRRQEQGLRLGLSHQTSLAHRGGDEASILSGWQIDATYKRHIAQPIYFSSHRVGVNGGMQFRVPETENRMRLALGVERERLTHSRPWRRHPHDIWHHATKLTFIPASFARYGLMLELNATASQSKDRFDRQKSFVFAIRYRWDDTKW